ncbi:glycosyltransferase [Haloarcula sp. JP-L23]|uniref:glycosyltransferase n=1 Tax=Haloarcula sp. JP-L23 TaxID=2716717 RepID=UPI00140F174F|nr:glycosyltransferase [Haloarcula sp. JP-L23]
MVFVLKEPRNDSKGIVVFTHKERAFLDTDIVPLVRRLHTLKREYIVGMHWGMYTRDADPVPFVDFHLARPNTVQFTEPGEIRRIPLASYNFIPPRFRQFPSPTDWDICTVGHPTKRKRHSDLLRVVRQLYDQGLSPRVLVVAGKTGNDQLNVDETFFDMYHTQFTDTERHNIDLATPVRDDDLFPIPNQLFPYIYNASRVCALFSAEEGNPKTIHEALLCGTPVLVRDDMAGSGQDYLTVDNAAIVSDLDEATETMETMLTAPNRYEFDPAALRTDICAEETVPRLEAALAEVFDDLGEPFEGPLRTTELWKHLPSHHTSVPREFCRPYTSDLKSARATYEYLSHLLSYDPGAVAPLQITARTLLDPDLVKRKAGTLVKATDDRTGLPLFDSVRSLYHRLQRL